MKLTSYGAVEGVTGSCHLLEVGSSRVLLDCGMFQGRGASEANPAPFPFDPSKVDMLLVSHAHLDHIGRIPLLYKEGFRGQIVSTCATYELARLSLLDSARIQDSDAERENRHRKKGEPEVEPLYDEEDVLESLELWRKVADYEERLELGDHLALTYHDAGHILGSAFLELELEDGVRRRKLIFSGDLGNVDKPIIHDPQPPPEADVVILESTYGDRDHRPFSETVKELTGIINETFDRGGNVVIPSFALERSQELLYVLYEAWHGGQIPEDVTIYLDSPMAIDATRIFSRYPEHFDSDALGLARRGLNPFRFERLRYTRHSTDSMRINQHRSKAVIIAGGGMLTGGRILHHLRHNIDRDACSVVFCGYQAEGTLGRKLVDGARDITMMGRHFPVRAALHTVNGFSGHAGQSTLTEWVAQTGAEQVYLVHGEQRAKEALGAHLLKATKLRQVELMPAARSVML